MSMQVKDAMIRLKSRKNLLDNLSGVAKSTVWYMLKKNECNCKLSNHKSPKTTVHADRVISMVKKNKSDEVKNSPVLSSSKFKIKRHLRAEGLQQGTNHWLHTRTGRLNYTSPQSI